MKTIASATGKLGTTIVIVGVGLIGGSIARAVRSRGLFERIIGVGRNPQRLQQAVEQGVIDEYACHGSEAAAQADLIVVCTPVEQIAEDVLELHACLPAGGVITDAGSTKGGSVVEFATVWRQGIVLWERTPWRDPKNRASSTRRPICSKRRL